MYDNATATAATVGPEASAWNTHPYVLEVKSHVIANLAVKAQHVGMAKVPVVKRQAEHPIPPMAACCTLSPPNATRSTQRVRICPVHLLGCLLDCLHGICPGSTLLGWVYGPQKPSNKIPPYSAITAKGNAATAQCRNNPPLTLVHRALPGCACAGSGTTYSSSSRPLGVRVGGARVLPQACPHVLEPHPPSPKPKEETDKIAVIPPHCHSRN